MASHLYTSRPLPTPLLTAGQWDPYKHILVKFEWSAMFYFRENDFANVTHEIWVIYSSLIVLRLHDTELLA